MNQDMTNEPISVQIESSHFCSPLYQFRMEDKSIKPRITPPPRRVSSSFSPEVSASEHPRDHEQLEKGVQYGGEGVQYGGQVILSHILFQVEVKLQFVTSRQIILILSQSKLTLMMATLSLWRVIRHALTWTTCHT